MKKSFLIAAAVLLLSSCAGKVVAHRTIAPLPAGVNPESLTDCTVPASFTSDDFGWMGGNLNLTVYNEDLYDAVDIAQMQPGDTLIYESEPLIVSQMEERDGTLVINGGVEEGGCWLQGYEGGTYRAVTFDDHSIYTALGKAHLPLADDFLVIDCGPNPTDPSDTIRKGQKLYLETLEGYRRQFTFLDTRVLVENGIITQIQRHWIP